MTPDFTILQLIREASPVVQFVMFILLIASVISWTYIFAKRSELKNALAASQTFEDRFWSGIELPHLYQQLNRTNQEPHGIESVFMAGYHEFIKLRKQTRMAPTVVVEGAQRAMRVALSRELDRLDEKMSFLATVGSTSPYVGLFGTVWGIMNSFRALGDVQQATLAMVAPGISEALVATAMGLFAAIPAVVGYNRFSAGIDKLVARDENFMEEFVGILQREAHTANTNIDPAQQQNNARMFKEGLNS